jgi:hypothetical protein
MIQVEQINDVAIAYSGHGVDVTFARLAEAEVEKELQMLGEKPGVSLLAGDILKPILANGDIYAPCQGKSWSFSLGGFYDPQQVAYAIANCLRDEHGLRVALTRIGSDFEEGDYIFVSG